MIAFFEKAEKYTNWQKTAGALPYFKITGRLYNQNLIIFAFFPVFLFLTLLSEPILVFGNGKYLFSMFVTCMLLSFNNQNFKSLFIEEFLIYV